MVLFFTSTTCNKSCAVYTPPASISLAICRWCDICIFHIRNEDVVVVVAISYTNKLECSSYLSWQTPPPEPLEILLLDSFERSFGNPLRALFLRNRGFFYCGGIFAPNTRRPLACFFGFWPSGPKPCGRRQLLVPRPSPSARVIKCAGFFSFLLMLMPWSSALVKMRWVFFVLCFLC